MRTRSSIAKVCLGRLGPRTLRLVAALISSFFAGSTSSLQAEDMKPALNSALEMSLEDLMQVEIVSASKTSSTIEDTPASVQVITSKDIQRFGYRSLSEALQNVLGFYITDDRNYEYLGVRGFSRPGDFNTRVLVLLDGHRLNDPIYDEGPVGNHFPVSIENIERIEIIKGPGSAVWGTNALLAVINVFTKRGKDIDGTVIGGDVGSELRRKGYAQFGKEYANGLDVAAAVSALNSQGASELFFPEFSSDPAEGTARYNDDEKYRNGYLSARYQEFSFLVAAGRRRKTTPTASYGSIFGSDDLYSIDESVRAEVSYETTVAPEQEGKLIVRAGYDYTRYHGLYAYALEDGSSSLYRDYSYARHIGGETRFSFSPLESISIVLGGEAHSNFDLENGGGTVEPYVEEDSRTTNDYSFGALFANLRAEILPSLLVEGGLRLDHYSTFGNSWNPRLGIIVKPLEGSALKFSYGRAFRAPNDYELHFESPSIAPNPNLEPEKMENFEVIWEQNLGSNTHITTSYFHYTLDEIITQGIGADDRFVFSNLDGVEAHGVELDARSRTTQGIEYFGGLSYVDAEDKNSGSHLTNSPYLLGRGGFSVPMLEEKIFLSPEFRYNGPRSTIQGSTSSSNTIVNVTILGKKLLPHFTMALSAYNLLDRRISYPAGNEHTQDTIPGRGRELRFSIEAKF